MQIPSFLLPAGPYDLSVHPTPESLDGFQEFQLILTCFFPLRINQIFSYLLFSVTIVHMDNNEQSIRINKYISASGYCSRREADRLIEAGRVRIDGVVAVMGSRVNPKMTVTVDDTELNMAEDRVVYALNKPAGYISSLSDEQGQGISCFIPDGMRLFPVGRLDKESEGLMLLTNDGELMNNLLNAAGGHEK